MKSDPGSGAGRDEGGLPRMAAAHQKLLKKQQKPPPPRVDPAEARRLAQEHLREMVAAFNELGARFARWAKANGHPPASYGKLGKGWRIGDVGTSKIGSDPSIGQGYAHSRDHAHWYVLEDGTVTTIADIRQQRLGMEKDTRRFVKVVRKNWGCDLDAEPPAEPPHSRPRWRRGWP